MNRLSPDDAGLWQRAMRDVAPLRRQPQDRRHSVGPAKSGSERLAVPIPAPSRDRDRPARALPQPAEPLDRFAGVDRATAERVKRGRYPVADRLDLHGMTQDEAHRALTRFVVSSRAAGKRCVLVITGHGRLSGGVLKAAVPRWLAEPQLRPDVLAIAPARPPHGGSGALYVLLRRPPQP